MAKSRGVASYVAGRFGMRAGSRGQVGTTQFRARVGLGSRKSGVSDSETRRIKSPGSGKAAARRRSLYK